ncbi:MAG: hypothetical protein AB7E37_04595 [Candidatus Altimarinota bacterium]
MKKILQIGLKGIFSGITFMLGILLVVYASNIALNELGNKNEGDALSLDMWNSLVGHVEDLKNEIDNIELIPGPQGEKGEKGDTGPQGANSEGSLICYKVTNFTETECNTYISTHGQYTTWISIKHGGIGYLSCGRPRSGFFIRFGNNATEINSTNDVICKINY